MPSALERIGAVARRDKKIRFTTLMHHVYNLDRLREAYFGLKRDAAPGVDGETWREYGEQLEKNLEDLSERLKRGAYRAKPVRRVLIPKADGGTRPLGVTTVGAHAVSGILGRFSRVRRSRKGVRRGCSVGWGGGGGIRERGRESSSAPKARRVALTRSWKAT
jgi:hypothetical protein